LSSSDKVYLRAKSIAETTSRQSNYVSCSLTPAGLNISAPPELLHNLGQINPNINNYHTNCVGIISIYCVPDITARWCQQNQAHSKYTDHSIVAYNIFSFIPCGVRLEGSICLGLHLIGLRQSITTAGTFCEILVLMKLPAAILAGNVTTLDIMITENDFEMISEAEEWKFHSLVMVHDIMGM
jgi:hypothetical protein